MRDRSIGKFLTIMVAGAFLLAMTVLSFSQAAPAAQGGGAAAGARGAQGAGAPAAGQPAAQGRGGGGRGQNAAPPEPTPRLPDGTVNLGRTASDVNGAWNLPYITNMGARNIVVGAPPAPAAPAAAGGGGRGGGAAAAPAGGGGGGRGLRGGAASEPWVPFQEWSAAVYNYHSLNESKYDPEGYCLPPGGPRLYATPYPMVMIQQPELKRIYQIFEGGAHVWREIYMDGRPHPAKDTLAGTSWLGHSVGKWEGDTLVVDVVGFNEGTWLDYFGHPHTDQMHVVERWTRPNKNQLRYEATIDDPGAYTAPWTVTWNINWSANAIDEYICQENNQYLNHLKDDFGRFVIDRGTDDHHAF